MHRVKIMLLLVALIGGQLKSQAQVENVQNIKKREKSANNAVLFNFYYTALFPVGELSHRFGFSNNVGFNVSYKMQKNWLIGVEGAYFFGNSVKELQEFSGVATSSGQFITTDGNLQGISAELSGFDFKLRVSKIIPVTKKNPNSGVLLSLAGGFLQHKIWINVDEKQLPQFDKTYRKGYDRLTNGPEVTGFAGYLYLSRKHFLSFYGGVEYGIAFTQNRRNWDFELMRKDDHNRLDMYVGLKVGWVIPVFTNKDNEEYYR